MKTTNKFYTAFITTILVLGLSACTEKKTSANEDSIQAEKGTIVILDTNRGQIHLKIWPDTAPKACESFTKLAKEGYYNKTIFHRVIPNFMIQGGDPTGTGMGGDSFWGFPFEDEVSPNLTFSKPGLLAMANAGPNTNGSQFFITTAATPWLNGKHTIFGEVVEGYDVVKAIEATPTGQRDKPLDPQVIIGVVVR